MKLSLFMVLLTMATAVVSRTAEAETFVFVDRAIDWKKSRAGETGQAKLLFLDSDHHMFSIETVLKRKALAKPITLDLDHGYWMFCGTWAADAADKIAITGELVESYRYAALAEKRQLSYSLRMSGDDWGPLRKTIADDLEVFEPLPALHFDDKFISSSKFVCSEHGKPQ